MNMATLVERVAQLLVSDADSRGVTIARMVEPGLAASGDEARLREVVMNLVLNALDASKRGGEVRMQGTKARTGEIELSVEDDGAGVVPDQREQIYQPFFTTKAQGTGLGLAIVHSIVTQHRGSLRLESSEKGGAAFRVRLPARSAISEGSDTAGVAAIRAKPGTDCGPFSGKGSASGLVRHLLHPLPEW